MADSLDLARVERIVADLKQAGGWDLTGYEDFLVDNLPSRSPEPDWLDSGCLWIKRPDGAWAQIGKLLTVSREHHSELIEWTNVTGQRQAIAGLQQETITMEIEMACSTSEFNDLTYPSDVVEMRVSAPGHLLETTCVVTGAKYDQIWAGAPIVAEIMCTIVR